jgi:hypothetical protein
MSELRLVSYEDCGATFAPTCPVCGRFVKADATILANADGYYKEQPNATCKKCGRVEMPFVGYY